MNQRKVKELLSIATSPRLLIGIFAVAFLIACSHPKKEDRHSSFGKIISDTYLVAQDSTDSWAQECLSDFKRNDLIEEIFTLVYSGKLTSIDYFSGQPIKTSTLKQMEADKIFTRKDITKIQFEESWSWNKLTNTFQKQIISMTVAYEVYNVEGKSRGQKPIFKLIFKNKVLPH